MKVDWLVVGAGFTGAVLAERIASQLDQKVLVVDRRDHIGGNAYDYYDEHGVLVHKYGPHIFHTNSRKVWNYLSQFTEWRPYYHRVLASVEGRLVPVPFNLNSLYALFPPRYAERLEEKLIYTYGFGVKIPILKMREAEDSDLRFLADYIYKNIFYGYTLKQWELKPEELDPSVTGRVPVYISRDDRYFQDTYQAMPKHGYTTMFANILRHKNIKVLLNTDYREVVEDIKYARMVYTGPIDAFFDYMHGKLPYRSLRFDFMYEEIEQFQPVGQVNYPNEHSFTRLTEFKHLTGQKHVGTT
ncbi:MAG: UDP-galactopyranose mutase, partial [Meiothermus sp.]|uniref:UDP-galactopyranose mutase n=1 Tax=Meiothermus sp. TaxID=1955249 RepID=UPI0025F4E615